MSEERHEIRCDACRRWIPLTQEWEDYMTPAGWMRLIVRVELDDDGIIEICSRMCLLRWAVFHG